MRTASDAHGPSTVASRQPGAWETDVARLWAEESAQTHYGGLEGQVVQGGEGEGARTPVLARARGGSLGDDARGGPSSAPHPPGWLRPGQRCGWARARALQRWGSGGGGGGSWAWRREGRGGAGGIAGPRFGRLRLGVELRVRRRCIVLRLGPLPGPRAARSAAALLPAPGALPRP